MKRFLVLLLFCNLQFAAQQAKIDSLFKFLKTAKEDSSKARILYNLSVCLFQIGDNDKAISYAGNGVELADKLKSKYDLTEIKADFLSLMGSVHRNQGNYSAALNQYSQSLKIYERGESKGRISDVLNNIGLIYNSQGNYQKALQEFQKCLKVYKEINDQKKVSSVLTNIGSAYYLQGNYSKALEQYYMALTIRDSIGDKRMIAYSLTSIGNIQSIQGDNIKALDNFSKCLKIVREINDKQGIAGSLTNIGIIYYNLGNQSSENAIKISNNEKALENYFNAKKIYEEIGEKNGIASSLMNIGAAYYNNGNLAAEPSSKSLYYKNALSHYFQSLEIYKELGEKRGIATSFINICDVNYKEKKYAEAIKYADSGLALSKEIGSKDYIKESYRCLFILDSAMGNWKQAFYDHKLYVIFRDSLLNEENTKKTVEAEMNYEFNKREEAAKIEQAKKDVITIEEKQKQKIIIISISCGLILVLVLAVVIFKSLLKNKQKNKIITEQKELVEKQKLIVEEKQKEVLDSIRYAKRIQTALITSEKYIEKSLRKLAKK